MRLRKEAKQKTTEKEFGVMVEELLDLFGWHWCHFRPARTAYGWRTAISGSKGFPDYIAVKNRLVIFELKSDDGKLSLEQQKWYDLLKASGTEVYVWKPKDLESIAEVLGSK